MYLAPKGAVTPQVPSNRLHRLCQAGMAVKCALQWEPTTEDA
jgi:hypothetical protein